MLRKIPHTDIDKLLKDHANFKILIAESFLDEIPKTLPLSWSLDLAKVLANVEAFVYFIISAGDILALEINKKLKVVDNRKCDMDKLFDGIKKVEQSNEVTKKIFEELNKSLSTPIRSRQRIEYSEYEKIINNFTITGMLGTECEPNGGDYKYFSYKWETENSWLWELTMLRHQTTHERTVGWQGYVDSNDQRKTTIILPLKENSREPYDHHEIDNPYDYCKERLEKMKLFVKSIRMILNTTPES